MKIKQSAIRLFALSLIVSLSTSSHSAFAAASPSAGGTGLGVMLGDPSSLTFKHWTSGTTAIDGHLSYRFGDYVAVMADHLWHFPGAFNSMTRGKISNQFLPYVGLGGALFFSGEERDRKKFLYRDQEFRSVALGARVPLGIEFLPRNLPLGFFLELTPGVAVVPAVFGFFQGGIGARYYF
jgi:hypothetical protein